jgi:Ice-binding-like
MNYINMIIMKYMNMVILSFCVIILAAALLVGCSNNPTGGGALVRADNSKGSSPGVIPGTGQLTPGAGGPDSVNLGTAADFAILSEAGIDAAIGSEHITGDIGVSPVTSTAITGFGLSLHGTYATSSLVTGKVYAPDYSSPTPTKMTDAVADFELAFTDANGRVAPAPVTELGAGDISGLTLAPGIYKWGTGVLVNGGLTLKGGANSTWIFQIAQTLTVGGGAIITLSGGAQAKNVYWVVTGNTILGTTANFKGNILCQGEVDMKTSTIFLGRAMSHTAVNLQGTQVTKP